MDSVFKTKLIQGDLLIGTIVTLSSTEVAEIYSQCGFDWLFLDLEHSSLTIKDAQNILQTITPKTPCLIRVPTIDEIWIKKALDIGAAGIILPQVQTVEDATLAVQLNKYPPQGIRSVGISRAQAYGDKFKEYMESANAQTAIIIQIEHIDAVYNIEKILEVPGIDGIFIGPYDLSASMGKTGLVSDPEVQKAISVVKNQAIKAKIPLGIFSATPDDVQPYIESGYTLIAVGIDTMLIVNAAKKIINKLK
jgi:2-dehydro-3-deoxyglucarate aldolase